MFRLGWPTNTYIYLVHIYSSIWLISFKLNLLAQPIKLTKDKTHPNQLYLNGLKLSHLISNNSKESPIYVCANQLVSHFQTYQLTYRTSSCKAWKSGSHILALSFVKYNSTSVTNTFLYLDTPLDLVLTVPPTTWQTHFTLHTRFLLLNKHNP